MSLPCDEQSPLHVEDSTSLRMNLNTVVGASGWKNRCRVTSGFVPFCKDRNCK